MRTFLKPFALLYGAILRLRHALYDAGVLRAVRPAVPTIAIGNLALGGTGKTPMLELVLRTLAGTAPLATLSRGYGRNGTGLHEVQATDTFELSGDEPLQVKRKFPEARVFVGADRVGAIARIQAMVPGVKAVLLDDALQHRRLDAGLNILLTTWQRPWCDDALLPAGRLRDLPSRRKAAQIVVVTKCPDLPSPEEQARWRERLGLSMEQELFFAGIAYEELKLAVGSRQSAVGSGQSAVHQDPIEGDCLLPTAHCLLFTGIENPQP
ncbi:MAG: tetraacyldisaccharide 4'-kinase, partial [Flavobacteriales bacterium]